MVLGDGPRWSWRVPIKKFKIHDPPFFECLQIPNFDSPVDNKFWWAVQQGRATVWKSHYGQDHWSFRVERISAFWWSLEPIPDIKPRSQHFLEAPQMTVLTLPWYFLPSPHFSHLAVMWPICFSRGWLFMFVPLKWPYNDHHHGLMSHGRLVQPRLSLAPGRLIPTIIYPRLNTTQGQFARKILGKIINNFYMRKYVTCRETGWCLFVQMYRFCLLNGPWGLCRYSVTRCLWEVPKRFDVSQRLCQWICIVKYHMKLG